MTAYQSSGSSGTWRRRRTRADSARRSGKRFVTANNSGYDTLDPHVVFDIGRIGSRLNMYDCLVRWVDNPPELKMWLADEDRHRTRRRHLHGAR